jgi:predicted secreted hydrolase
MTTLTHSVTESILRSTVEDWQPHGKQSESTTEWWYLSALSADANTTPV